ncbi:MAG: thioredoxin family protein [Verrucomicrobia bacterium]|nr:thioredoxin family protein [Verrucomicrobiota bacterium]
MKKFFVLFIVSLLGFASIATAGAGWPTDFEKAKAEAAARNVPILIDFSGSDWCGWCIRLDKEVFSQPEFKAYASENLVLFLADFPRRKPQSETIKKQNKQLSDQYGLQGYPTVLLLDANGKELARTGYRKGGPVAYVEHLKALLK